ncbi:MAG: DNA translocase FtsK 4TM domain-containing protein [Puniceicoccales bacterium]|jgi:S-DNA-T family DNA segregation ATPase FtsK/SpoIIIE|nr:DNA translocase FtsK 4TM domain-containing protein [Puniceicoccales bacterium]
MGVLDKSTQVKSEKKIRKIFPALLCFMFGALFLISFLDFQPQQTKLISTGLNDGSSHENLIGRFGAYATFYSIRYLGLAYWLIPLALIFTGYVLLFPNLRNLNKRRILAMIFAILSIAGICEFIHQHMMSADGFLKFSQNKYSGGLGGIVGTYVFYYLMEPIFGEIGGIIILSTILILSLVYSLAKNTSSNVILEREVEKYGYFRAIILKNIKRLFLLLWKIIKILFKLTSWLFASIFKAFKKKAVKNYFANNRQPSGKIDKKLEKNMRPSPPTRELHSEKKSGDYIFPTIDLLQQSPRTNRNGDDHGAISAQLVQTLAQFGIEVHPGEVHTGPVITRYEITPAPGVRVEKILNLDKNIALNLRAQSVRILAPVPGKGCVGVELPNKAPQMVCLREILESQDWAHMKADIPIVLGRGTTGDPMINDLAKMPHLLIAGSTGSGKTVCINAIIASLVYHASPEDLRFIMVDPKIVEMQVFNDLPHMLIPVVTDPKKVPNALKWLISEMERRYKIFAKIGVRNIAGFNAKILRDATEQEKAKELELSLSPEERSAINDMAEIRGGNVDVPKTKMSYIVCIIDELADLMLVAPADIETSVARLAQLARAAGIHLILATQRPSVNVITGIIKANLPSRIAFKVASKVDSRTILDIGGAESLLGRGDMLFQPPGASGLLRAQGALVSDDEINNIVQFLKEKNGPPKYMMDVHEQIESFDGDENFESEDWEDDMIPQALEVLRSSDRASTSLLQRRLKIGYNRAARIMEALESKGLISLDRNSRDAGNE